MSFDPRDVLFISPLDRHKSQLEALQQGFGAGTVQAGAGFKESLRAAFKAGRPIVGLCAAGILIRALSDLLSDKTAEPPVVATTETGDFIPLLGGHHGANQLARDLAEANDGFALISTATDALLGAAVEDPAEGFVLLNPEHAGAFQKSLAADPRPVAIKGRWPLRSAAPEAIDPASDLSIGTEGETSETALVYAAKDLIVGVGCERGAETETLVEAVQKALADAQLDPRRVAGLVSVDLKQDEPALAALSEALEVPLRVFASDELKDVAVPNPSAVVQDEIGTPSVSEASALLGAGAGSTLVLEKQKFGIGTVAVAQATAPIESFDAGRA
ncbi:MAG: cobalt-precorrin 5A hydrolase, partial [Alphaproteobacteria bacterium]